MTKPFPNHPFLSGPFAPFGAETDVPDLIVEGDLPADLEGFYVRNGPDKLHAPREPFYHWFDGDGMIWAFRFADGRVSLKNRWVRTKKFEVERKAGRSLWGTFGNPMTSDPSVRMEDYNTGNTNIFPHGKKLYALMEGALPVEMDTASLETKGETNFAGAVQGPVTAHPKADAKTGEMFFFGYQAKGPMSKDIRYNVANAKGEVTRNVWFEGPYSPMMHDFMVTAKHVVFPFFPLTFELERAMKGQSPSAWEPKKGTHFAIMPRDGNANDIRWCEFEPRFGFHVLNSWEDGNTLFTDFCISDDAGFFMDMDGDTSLKPKAPVLRRWRFDLSKKDVTVKEEVLDTASFEFPRTDDRVQNYAHRHAYGVGSKKAEAALTMDSLFHYDTKTGKRADWFAGEGAFIGEPIFAPRKGSTGEADGYVVMLRYDGKRNQSDLLIFDALKIEAGPRATIRVPFRIPPGFHGNWVEA